MKVLFRDQVRRFSAPLTENCDDLRTKVASLFDSLPAIWFLKFRAPGFAAQVDNARWPAIRARAELEKLPRFYVETEPDAPQKEDTEEFILVDTDSCDEPEPESPTASSSPSPPKLTVDTCSPSHVYSSVVKSRNHTPTASDVAYNAAVPMTACARHPAQAASACALCSHSATVGKPQVTRVQSMSYAGPRASASSGYASGAPGFARASVSQSPSRSSFSQSPSAVATSSHSHLTHSSQAPAHGPAYSANVASQESPVCSPCTGVCRSAQN